MENKYLTTDEAIKAMMDGKKLKGYTDTNYCYYDSYNFGNPFRYLRGDGFDTEMRDMWEHNRDKWEIFEEPVYEWQYLYKNESYFAVSIYMTDEEFSNRNFSKNYSSVQKIEQSKRERK